MKKENALSHRVLPPLNKQSNELSKPMSHAVKASSLVGDEVEARERVGAQASAMFEQHYGSIVSSELDVQHAQEIVDKVASQLADSEQALRDHEPSYEPVLKDSDRRLFSWSVFSEWRTLDIGFVFVLLLLTPVMMGVATVNLASIIDNAKLPVFIASPWKMWLIALIAPAAALALDLLPKSLNNPKQEKRYVTGLFIFTAVIVICWVAMFSNTFDGFNAYVQSSGDEFDTELPPVSDSRFYSFVQLLSEILISSSLVAGLELIFKRYQPLQEIPHPLLPKAKEIHRGLLEVQTKAKEQLSLETLRHNTLVNARQAFINHWLDELTINRTRYAMQNNFFEEK